MPSSIELPATRIRFLPVYLIIAIAVSLLVHLFVLFVQFIYPDNQGGKGKATIEIILVNANNSNVIPNATVYANAGLSGGGDTDNGRRTSPLMQYDMDKDGNALKEQEAQVASKQIKMERALLAAKKNNEFETIDLSLMSEKEQLQWKESFNAIARRQAEIEKQINDYNARPKKYFDGPHTTSHEAAVYVHQWRDRVESWGNSNYPSEAKGKIYGDVILTIEIDPSGQPTSIQVEKSSGSIMLDNAAINSVKHSGPFGAFSREMRSKMDILVLTRTWVYSPNGLVTEQKL